MSLVGYKIPGRRRRHVFLSPVPREECFVAKQDGMMSFYYTLSCAKPKPDLEQTRFLDDVGEDFS